MKRLYAVGSENGGDGDAFSGKNAKQWTLCYRRWTGSTCMNISTETREILRNYKAVINGGVVKWGRNRSPLRRLLMKSRFCGESAGGFPRWSLYPSGHRNR